MSWFFYMCIAAVVFLVVMWWLIVKVNVYCYNTRSMRHEIFTLFTVLTCGFILVCMFVRGISVDQSENGLESKLYIDNDSSQPVVITVIADTMLFDGLRKLTLQPGEAKRLSSFAGGYRVVSNRKIPYTTQGSAQGDPNAGFSIGLSRRYDELTK